MGFTMQYRQSFAQGANWQNFENHTDVVDPQHHDAKLARDAAAGEERLREHYKRQHLEAAKRPPNFISTDEASRRNVGFIVMNCG
jgi:hypothetical protein